VVARAQRVVLENVLADCWPVGMGCEEEETNLVLLQESPFGALFGLAALAVVAPLHGVAHGRHGG